MSVLVLVPARGGSKGLPGKNLRQAGGLTLTARAILTGRAFLHGARPAMGAIVVDTDAPDIAAEARRFGAEVPFLRDPALAQDDTATVVSALVCLERLRTLGRPFDAVVLLQPTAPLRTAADVAACWAEYDSASNPSVVAVTPLEPPAELAVRLDDHQRIGWASGNPPSTTRRQDFPRAYRISGAVYVTSVACLQRERAFVVPGVSRGVELPLERSLDVDTASDLSTADTMLRASDRELRDFRLANRSIGGRAPCFVIAEGGVNHNGDPALAHRLIDVAADAGADAVKFQTFVPERLAASSARQARYQTANIGQNESQLEMLRRLVLPKSAYGELKMHAEARGLVFLSTPFDEESADFLESLGVIAFKVPSGELTNLALLRHLARKGKPLIVSSGMATMPEVADAVSTIAEAGDPPLALLHCVTNYPAHPAQCNLAVMATMRASFGLPVGWSDHTLGIEVAVAAAALGAALIEKHFTLNRELPGPDHKASLDPPELTAMVRGVRIAEASRGTGVKAPLPEEIELAGLVRKSLHAARDLPAGHTLQETDVVALRPGGGVPPSALSRLVGRTLRAAAQAGTMLEERHFE